MEPRQYRGYLGKWWKFKYGRGNLSGLGTQTAALAIGGSVSPKGQTEEYNGTSFTEKNDLNTGRMYTGSAGSVTAGLVFAGYTSPPATNRAETETWNGTSWTEVADLNTARHAVGGGGTQSSAICIDGNPRSGSVELWDGSSWTETTNLNTNRDALGGAAEGSESAIAFGGNTPPVTANTETWNGTAWTEVNNLNTARTEMGTGGRDN